MLRLDPLFAAAHLGFGSRINQFLYFVLFAHLEY
jgi:hypothetical protein